jgi:hypothetical protein
MTSDRRAILWLLIVMPMALAGCGKDEYDHHDLDLQSKQAAEARTMLTALRAGSAGEIETQIAEHGASDLTDDQTQALAAWLEQIRSAEGAELIAIDRFGEQVYRVTIELQHDGTARPSYGLLVQVDGELKWAGPN